MGGEDVSSSDDPGAADFGNVAQERVLRIVGCARPGVLADSATVKTPHADRARGGPAQPIRLARKRADAASRNSPKAISSRRLESAWASRAPYPAVRLETGAITATPSSHTNQTQSGGSIARVATPYSL